MTSPDERTPDMGVFDRFAGWVATMVSRAPFFGACAVLVLIWLIQGGVRIAIGGLPAFMDDKYQLEINTTTTIITFLLVALLQNSQARSDTADQEKLNTIAKGLRDLMVHQAHTTCVDGCDFEADIAELEEAIGLERNVGTKKGTGSDSG